MKRTHLILQTAIFCIPLLLSETAAASDLNQGSLLYHSYTAYDAQDSKLFLHHFNSGETFELSDNSFHHAMNADFGSHPYDIVFMAIDSDEDEWDLYRYNRITGQFTNLTEKSGCRNEDPKFSPDGMSIVFKRGWWDSELNGFHYELAELSHASMEITMLTDGGAEESMPYYSNDGTWIYYAQSGSDADGIYRLNRETLTSETVYAKEDHAYYPVVLGDALYFTKWYDSSNQMDCIMSLSDGIMPFCDGTANFSDPCPLPYGEMIYSSTSNGSYDLYFWDGSISTALNELNSDQQELGAAYYSSAQRTELIGNTTAYLLEQPHTPMNMDADGDGCVNAFDLAFFKKNP